jgi:PAS domain S-box-containing protein
MPKIFFSSAFLMTGSLGFVCVVAWVLIYRPPAEHPNLSPAELAHIQSDPPDLVLTDVMMPRMDGFALLRELREGAETRDVPVIMLSARAGEESRIEGLGAGADAYLTKPFSARELLARVGALLELDHMRRTGEQAFRRRSAQYETLFNEAPLGVYLVDADFKIREANPTAVAAFGNIPELIGRDFGDVIPALSPQPTAAEIVHRFRHTLETGEPYFSSVHAQQRLDRGTTEYYEWQINRIRAAGRLLGVVCYRTSRRTCKLARGSRPQIVRTDSWRCSRTSSATACAFAHAAEVLGRSTSPSEAHGDARPRSIRQRQVTNLSLARR